MPRGRGCLATPNGRLLFRHLRRLFLDRRLPPTARDAELRHVEGQRSVVAHLLQLMERGRGPAPRQEHLPDPRDPDERPSHRRSGRDARPMPLPRPADVPAKFWDDEAGAVRIDALLKSYVELERKLGSGRREPEPHAEAATPIEVETLPEPSPYLRRLGSSDRRRVVPMQGSARAACGSPVMRKRPHHLISGSTAGP